MSLGKIHYKKIILSVLVDTFFSILIGGIIGAILLIKNGPKGLEQVYSGLGFYLTSLIGGLVTFFIAKYLVQKIKENTFNNLTLFVIIESLLGEILTLSQGGKFDIFENLFMLTFGLLFSYLPYYLYHEKN